MLVLLQRTVPERIQLGDRAGVAVEIWRIVAGGRFVGSVTWSRGKEEGCAIRGLGHAVTACECGVCLYCVMHHCG